MKFAFYQNASGGSVAENLILLRENARLAAEKGAHLIAFSEVFLTGYYIGDGLHTFAEEQNGPSFQEISAIAKQYKIWILYGYPEKVVANNGADAKTVYYNSAAVVNPDGVRVVNYRKIHLYSDYEKKYFTHGAEYPPVVDIEGIKVSVLICWDFEFPENLRIMTLKGANFVIAPTANTLKFMSEITARARAFENQIFVAYVNRVGLEGGLPFCGDSVCVASDGSDLARAPDNAAALMFAEIEPNKPEYIHCKSRNPYLEDRQPALYSLLTKEKDKN